MKINKKLKEQLITIARKKISSTDPSHDINHALRVMNLCSMIAIKEEGNEDILVPAALFHDLINYPKDHSKAKYNSSLSAESTKTILDNISEYPKSKIDKTCKAIEQCSFTKNIKPDFIESAILQDADGIEATGAISIMRTFASAGSMQKIFYNPKDPFCEKRSPNDKKYSIDLFYSRLMQIEKRLHTETAKEIAKKRIVFLQIFLNQLKKELEDTND